MSKESIGFRIEADKRVALDQLANAMRCDRSTVINEAIEAYLELHHWQVELIEKRLAAADAGDQGTAHDDVFARMRQRLKEQLN